MARYGEFSYGQAMYGRDQPQPPPTFQIPTVLIDTTLSGPLNYRTKSASHKRVLLDVNGNPITASHTDPSGIGLVIIGGSIQEEENAVPRIHGTIQVENPDGVMQSLFTQGMVVSVEDRLSYPNGLTYRGSLGRLGIVNVHKKADAGHRYLELEVIQQSQVQLAFSVTGDLPAVAAPTARLLGLLGPDNVTASIEGIMAWILLQGGATAIGIEGVLRPTIAYSGTFGGRYVSAFIIAPQATAMAVMKRCMEMTGVTYYVDWDGTAVLKVAPTSSGAVQRPPIRTFAATGIDAVVTDIDPSPGVPVTQIDLLNQSTTGAPRLVSYVVPLGFGVPVPTTGSVGNVNKGQYKRFDASIFAAAAIDPYDKQTEQAKRLAWLESLAANEVTFSIPPDPFIHAGDTVILNFPTYDAVGLYWVKKMTHPLGMGKATLTGQRLFTATQLGSAVQNSQTYVWGNQTPISTFLAGSTYSPGYWLVAGPAHPELYHHTPATFEGWLRLIQWPSQGGNNLQLVLIAALNCEVLMNGNGATMSCTVKVYDETGGTPATKVVLTTLGPFNVVNNDDAWHHWVLQREAGWVGIFIDGVLKASSSAAYGLTDTSSAATYGADLYPYESVSMLRRSQFAALVTPDVTGQFSAYSWRFSRSAVYPHSNFAALTSAFNSNSYADFPQIVSVWPFLNLMELNAKPTDPPSLCISTTSNMYAACLGIDSTLGGKALPF